MVRYVITVDVCEDEINVDVGKDGKYVDEASFHISEVEEFGEYMEWVTTAIMREIMGEHVLKQRGK
ncbi:MAG: hypothetical protein DRJ31_07835 [Candidatus Methanomethylicota archaeon]|uniref:Uncharacterized protein n=1 Tax=Thermoproteota archaeon TaxID=2056631 RepID=A0A497ELF4_9CREN|nr:MAG: hypothetical protein DRJ31_07835 [Candidatus Verstraetearchaeota archaeon]